MLERGEKIFRKGRNTLSQAFRVTALNPYSTDTSFRHKQTPKQHSLETYLETSSLPGAAETVVDRRNLASQMSP